MSKPPSRSPTKGSKKSNGKAQKTSIVVPVIVNEIRSTKSVCVFVPVKPQRNMNPSPTIVKETPAPNQDTLSHWSIAKYVITTPLMNTSQPRNK